jgi:hypothetical protein
LEDFQALPAKELKEQLKIAYKLVRDKLPAKVRKTLSE